MRLDVRGLTRRAAAISRSWCPATSRRRTSSSRGLSRGGETRAGPETDVGAASSRRASATACSIERSGPLSTRHRTPDRPGEIGWRQARARHGHGAPDSGRRACRRLPRRRQASAPPARTGRDGSPRRRSRRACPRCRGRRRSPARASTSRRRAVPPVPDRLARWPRRPLCPEPGRCPTGSRPVASPRPPPRPGSPPTLGRRATAPRPRDSPPGAASNVAGAQSRLGSAMRSRDAS